MATDDFNRADENPLASPWANGGLADQLKLVGNEVVGASATSKNQSSYYTGTFDGAQFSQLTVTTLGSGTDLGPMVRCDPSGDGYCFLGNSSTEQLCKFTNGTYSIISTISMPNLVVSDVMYIEADGTTIVCKVNGSQVLSTTDASFSSGNPGIFIYPNNSAVDDWSGGNLAAGVTAAPVEGKLHLVGGQPTIKSALTVSPAEGKLHLVGGQPTVSAGAAQTVTPQTGTLSFSGGQPDVVTGDGHYSTDFAGTENPLSEGGVWQNNNTTVWHEMEKVSGIAHGAGYATVGNYEDCYALLKYLNVDPDQEVLATIYLNKGVWTDTHEWELHVRGNEAANSMQLYEGLIGFSGTGEIVRWNGAIGDFTLIGSGGSSAGNVQDYDTCRMTAVGTELNLYRNGTLLRTATDATYATGQPGIGIFNRETGTNSELGFRDYEARAYGVVTPYTGTIAFSGGQPTIISSAGAVAQPQTGAITLFGGQPTIRSAVTVAPLSGSLLWTGGQPIISTGTTATATPSMGVVAFAGGQPTIKTDLTVNPFAGALNFQGGQPTIILSEVTVEPFTGKVSLVGHQPTISTVGSWTKISAASGSWTKI